MQQIDARRPSLAHMVAQSITQAVLSTELPLGAVLSEEKLAATLGVSRTPVREALTALQLQGLVDILPQRGTFVFLPTGKDVAELCDLRSLIEGRALTLCHSHSKPATIAALRQANAAMREAHATADFERLAGTDLAFHDCMLAGCGNRLFARAYALISSRISALRANLLRVGEDVTSGSMDEHDAITDAFAAGDLAAAVAILDAHIARMQPRYAAALQAGLLGN